MLVPQKFLFQLLVAAVAFGGVACPCPTLAASEVETHAEHQSQSYSLAQSVDCQHSECVTDCSFISADFSEQDAMTCNGKYQFDDFDAIPPEFSAAYPTERFASWTGPPPPLWVVHDTPVRRFDRLVV